MTKVQIAIVAVLIPIFGIPLLYYALYCAATNKDPLKLDMSL